MMKEPYNWGQDREKDIQGTSIESNRGMRREKITSSKNRESKRQILWDDTVTTTYQDSDIVDMRLFSKLIIQIINLSTSINVLYTVYGCLDPNFKWETIKAESTIIANASGNASAVETLTDSWAFFKVQVKSASGTPKAKVISGVKT